MLLISRKKQLNRKNLPLLQRFKFLNWILFQYLQQKCLKLNSLTSVNLKEIQCTYIDKFYLANLLEPLF